MNRDRRILTLLAALGASVTHLVPGEPAESRLLVPTRIASETAGTPSRRVQRLKSDESIFIFPGFVCLAAGSTNWETTIHIWVGELEPRSAALGTLRGALGLATDVSTEESVIFRERTRWMEYKLGVLEPVEPHFSLELYRERLGSRQIAGAERNLRRMIPSS